jgi:hypothetical protein
VSAVKLALLLRQHGESGTFTVKETECGPTPADDAEPLVKWLHERLILEIRIRKAFDDVCASLSQSDMRLNGRRLLAGTPGTLGAQLGPAEFIGEPKLFRGVGLIPEAIFVTDGPFIRVEGDGVGPEVYGDVVVDEDAFWTAVE